MQQQSKYRSIILMGQTGSGKGTQAELLAKELGYHIFSTGDKTREYAVQDTPLGRHVASVHTTGWIPEWLASYVMTKALLEEYYDVGLVFESVARKLLEAQKLHEIHEALQRPYIVLYLACDNTTVLERQLNRGRNGYDTPENVEKRMAAFETETKESLAFFADNDKLITIDADQSIDEVFANIRNITTA